MRAASQRESWSWPDEDRLASSSVRTLVAGWFSFEDMGATAGDLLARDVACSWLERSREVSTGAPPTRSGTRT